MVLISKSMAKFWKITCKDCGDNFEYSDYVLQMDMQRGSSRPERCKECRNTHSSEIRAVGNSHFELTPLKGGPSILGVPFIGMLDHKGRTIEKLETHDKSVKMDLGLKDEHENTIKEIYKEIDGHQVIIIVAATGTGKSTYLPFRLAFPLLYENHNDPNKYLKYGPIIVTQPRVMATEGIPQAIAKNLAISKVGEGFEIGYKHGEKRQDLMEDDLVDKYKRVSKLRKKTEKADNAHEDYSLRNRLIFVTDGSLLNWISQGKIGQFSAIIIDEAHERSTNIDVILGLIKNELPKYPHLKLIILSATIDSKSFEDFFKSTLKEDTIKVLNYTSEKYAIKRFKYEEIGWKWSELTSEEIEYKATREDKFELNRILKDFIKEASVTTAKKVIELLSDKNSGGGILAFLPGIKEMKNCCEYIRKNYKVDERIKLFELHSRLPDEERDSAAEPFKETDKILVDGEKKFPRRIVIATNIAETSVTFDDIVHVVDSGLIKQSHWDSNACVKYMKTQFHSKDGCKQRWGRTGRKCNGFVYKLYPKDWFIRFFPHHTSPEIERSCLDDVFLTAVESGATDVSKLSWLTQPDSIEFNRVNNLLSERKLLDDDNDLTENGREVLRLRKSIGRIFDQFDNSSPAFVLDMASLMVKADKFGCLIESVTFAAAIPQLGASMYIAEDKIEKNYNGFFVWNDAWDMLTKDHVTRIQKHLQIGCIDDLDYIFKLSNIFDLYRSEETELFSDIVKTFFICESNLFKYLLERESLLRSFIKGKKDESIRSLEYKLVQKLRLLIPLALPDKIGTIVNHNGQIVFENNKGTKYLLSPNLAGSWNAGDKAIGLIYKQSPFIIEKNFEILLKDTPTAPYVELLVRINDSELYKEDNISNFQILHHLKRITVESDKKKQIIRNMFIPLLGPIGSEISKVPDNNLVAIQNIKLKSFQTKYANLVLDQEFIDQLEEEQLATSKGEKLLLKIKLNQGIQSLLGETSEILISKDFENNVDKYFIDHWEVKNKIVVAILNKCNYNINQVHPIIKQKDYVAVTIIREIRDSLSRKRIGYICRYMNQYFPIPIENMAIDPLVPFQESLEGRSVLLRKFKIKSLPFYYGLSILPYLENQLKSTIASQIVSLKLQSIKNDRSFGSWAYFKIQKENAVPIYLSVRYIEDYKFDQLAEAVLSFKIEREKIVTEPIDDTINLKKSEIANILERNNFTHDEKNIKHKDLRPINQFIYLFDVFYASTKNYSIYRTIRKLYTNNYRIEIQMKAIFDKLLKDIHNLINELGEITESDRIKFKQQIKDFQEMLRNQKPNILPVFDKIDEMVSAMWNLDTSDVTYKRLEKDLPSFPRRIAKAEKKHDEKKCIILIKKQREVRNKLDFLKNKRKGYFDTFESCREFIVNKFNIPSKYGVRIVGPSETFKTIQDAIDAAADGDLILVKSGNYNENLLINKNVTVKSFNSRKEEVIISTNAFHTVHSKASRVVLSSVVIKQQGTVDANNKLHTAVYNSGASLLLDNCEIISQSKLGVENSSNLYIYNSIIDVDNTEGIGIYSDEDSTISISRSKIKPCHCAIYSKNARSIYISESTVNANTFVSLNPPDALTKFFDIKCDGNYNRKISGTARRYRS